MSHYIWCFSTSVNFGMFFFSMDRAVGPFLDELGSTCAVTCLAESQPNGLFVITPVSLSTTISILKFRSVS